MIKNIILSIIMILSLAFCVSATGDLTLSPNTISYTTTSTQSINGVFTIANSNTTDTINITLPSTIDFTGTTSNITALAVTYNVSGSYPIANLSSESINYSFTIPANTTTQTYTAVLNVTDNTGNYNAQTITLNVQAINELLQVTQAPPQAIVVKTSSQDAISTFKIKNNGNIALTASFASSDLILNSTNSITSTNVLVNDGNPLSFAIGEEKEVSIKITPNTAYTSGTYTGNITTNFGAGNTTNTPLTAIVRDATTILNVPTSVVLGSTSNQARNKNVTAQFNITNNGVIGDLAITGITISSNAASKYNIVFSKDNTNFYTSLDAGSLAIAGTQAIYIKGFIPVDENSGSIDIGDIKITSNQANTTISSFTINPEQMLVIDDLDFVVDGDTDSNLNNGDTIKYDANPGDKVKMTLKLKNMFSSSSDITIEDVDVTATIEELDEGDDVDVDASTFDLDSGDSKTVDLTFDIPLKVDSGIFKIVINVKADDQNNAKHDFSWTIRLNIDKESHDLKITKANFAQNTLECIRSTTFTVNVLNIGDREESNGVIIVSSPNLGLNDKVEYVFDNIIDEDNILFSKTYDVNAKNIAPGTYTVQVKTYYASDILSDTTTANLIINACNDKQIEVADDSQEKTDAIILEQSAADLIQNGGSVAQEISTDSNESFLNSDGYTYLLIAGNIIAVIIVMFLIFKFLGKPKN